MEYAVIEHGGKQYKISVGDILEIDHVLAKEGENYTFDQVLLHVVDGKVNIGTPRVSGGSATAKILGNRKGPKVTVSKFKAKARFRRTTGHRDMLTRVEVTKIGSSTQTQKKQSTSK